MIRGIHHTGISVRDPERMLRFYRDVLGFSVVNELSWESDPAADAVLGIPGSIAWKTTLRAGNSFMEMFAFTAPPPSHVGPLSANDRGYTHVALLVENIEHEYQRLLAAAVTFNSEVQDFGPVRSVYGRDPEGNLFELLEVVDPQHPYLVAGAGW